MTATILTARTDASTPSFFKDALSGMRRIRQRSIIDSSIEIENRYRAGRHRGDREPVVHKVPPKRRLETCQVVRLRIRYP